MIQKIIITIEGQNVAIHADGLNLSEAFTVMNALIIRNALIGLQEQEKNKSNIIKPYMGALHHG